MSRIPHWLTCYYCIIGVLFTIIFLLPSETTAASDNALLTFPSKRRFHGITNAARRTNVMKQHHSSQQYTPSLLLTTVTTTSSSSRGLLPLLLIRGGAGAGGGGGGGPLSLLLSGKSKNDPTSSSRMQMAVVSATAVSLLHGVIDIFFPAAVCRFYNVPPATSSPGMMEEILIRRIGTLLLATGLLAWAVFFSSSTPTTKNWMRMGGAGGVVLSSLLPQTIDQAVALTVLVFWLESIYRLVKRLPTKLEFDATATWTNLLVNSVFLGFYLVAFLRPGNSATTATTPYTPVLAVTKWIIRVVLAHGVLGIVAPSAVLALGGFPPPRKNQDLAVVLGVTRAAGYWALAFAIFAMSVQNNVHNAGNDNYDGDLTMTLHHLRGFAYSRLVILFRCLYMNFASREVYTSLRLKQVIWLVFDFLVAAVLSQSFFWNLAFA
jgi:hypothetical protein